MKTALHYVAPLALVITLGIMAQAPASPPPALKEYTKFSQRTAQVQQAVATTVIAQNALDAANAISGLSATATIRSEDTSVIVYDDQHMFSYPNTVDEPINDWKMNRPVCSGFVAYSHDTTEYIVTAKHCVTTEVQYFMGVIPVGEIEMIPKYVRFFDGDTGMVEAKYLAGTDDVALLIVSSIRKHPYAFLHEGIQRGQHAFVMSQPDNQPWSYSDLIFMQGAIKTNSITPWEDTYLASCPSCFNGGSGGGVYNNLGQVVGMLVAGDSHSTLVVPARVVQRILNEAGP